MMDKVRTEEEEEEEEVVVAEGVLRCLFAHTKGVRVGAISLT